MKAYLDLLQDVLENGKPRKDRTGTGTLSLFSRSLRVDLAEGFPLLTTKKLHLKSILHELLWFLKGDTTINYLLENGVHIWSDWPAERWILSRDYDGPLPKDFKKAMLTNEYLQKQYQEEKLRFEKLVLEGKADGDLGPVYGNGWTKWGGGNQLADVIQGIKKQPYDRGHLVSAWNYPELNRMILRPCHYSFQFYVDGDKLNLLFNMRSTDVFLGLPYNIPSYAMLLIMVADHCGLEPGEVVWNGCDVHIYSNHLEQVKEQLTRTPGPLPSFKIKQKRASIFDYVFEDFELTEYEACPSIKAPVAI